MVLSSIKIWLEEELSSAIHSFVCSSELPVCKQFNERSQGQNCVPFATHYGCLCQFSVKILIQIIKCTLFEIENKRQKIEPVPIPLPRASRNFPDVKTRNQFFFHNWTSEIIPFIRFGMQMDGT